MIVFLIPIFIFLGVNNLPPCFHFLSFLHNHQTFIFRFSNSSINLSLCFTCQVTYQFHFLLGAIPLEFFFLLQSRSLFFKVICQLGTSFCCFHSGNSLCLSPYFKSSYYLVSSYFGEAFFFFSISFMNKKINRT